ncbi:MAG: dihydroxy-acid dehydratase, partial [Chitinophagaceae bacterium]|nr:dihydroxy-acid dehydratase [Chitinophagaceae bacterium]
MNGLNRYSREVTQHDQRPGAQSMLHAIGLTREDLKKPQVGIASAGWDGNPCNMHLNELARKIKASVYDRNLVGLIFNTAGVSDVIS